MRHKDQPMDMDFIEQQAYFQTDAQARVRRLGGEEKHELFKSIYGRLWEEMEAGVKKGHYL